MSVTIVKKPQRNHLVIMGQPCILLETWLQARKIQWRVSPKVAYAIDVDRNQAVNHFLNHEPEYTHLIMLDHDMVEMPDMASLEELFRENNHDLITLGYVGTSGSRGHQGNGDFGASAFRASRELLTKMGAPWFKTTYSEDLTQRINCECSHFNKSAKEQGVSCQMVGEIGHQQGGNGGLVLYPCHHNQHGFSFSSPYQLT